MLNLRKGHITAQFTSYTESGIFTRHGDILHLGCFYTRLLLNGITNFTLVHITGNTSTLDPKVDDTHLTCEIHEFLFIHALTLLSVNLEGVNLVFIESGFAFHDTLGFGWRNWFNFTLGFLFGRRPCLFDDDIFSDVKLTNDLRSSLIGIFEESGCLRAYYLHDARLAYVECVPPHRHVHHRCEFGFVDDATIPGKLGRDVIHSENTVDVELTTQIIKLNGVVKEGFFCRVIVHDITTNRFRLNRYVTR